MRERGGEIGGELGDKGEHPGENLGRARIFKRFEGELVRGVEAVSAHCVHSHIPQTYEGAGHAEYLEKYY